MRRTLLAGLLLLVVAPAAEAGVASRANAICRTFAVESATVMPATEPSPAYVEFAAGLAQRRAAALAALSPRTRDLVRADRATARILRAGGLQSAKLRRTAAAGDRAARRLGARACVAPLAPQVLKPLHESSKLRVSQIFFEDGNPVLSAYATTYNEVTWRVCPSDQPGCYWAERDSGSLHAGPQPAGTVFEVFTHDLLGIYFARSDPWGGQVTSTAPPQLTGTPEVGESVTPVAGSWTGGWGDEYDHLRIQVCRAATPVDCVTLLAPGVRPYGSAVIPAEYEGRYLFAVDLRIAMDRAFALGGYDDARDVPPVQPAPAVAFSAPVGPIQGAG